MITHLKMLPVAGRRRLQTHTRRGRLRRIITPCRHSITIDVLWVFPVSVSYIWNKIEEKDID